MFPPSLWRTTSVSKASFQTTNGIIPFSFRNEPVAAICSRMLNEVKSRLPVRACL